MPSLLLPFQLAKLQLDTDNSAKSRRLSKELRCPRRQPEICTLVTAAAPIPAPQHPPELPWGSSSSCPPQAACSHTSSKLSPGFPEPPCSPAPSSGSLSPFQPLQAVSSSAPARACARAGLSLMAAAHPDISVPERQPWAPVPPQHLLCGQQATGCSLAGHKQLSVPRRAASPREYTVMDSRW